MRTVCWHICNIPTSKCVTKPAWVRNCNCFIKCCTSWLVCSKAWNRFCWRTIVQTVADWIRVCYPICNKVNSVTIVIWPQVFETCCCNVRHWSSRSWRWTNSMFWSVHSRNWPINECVTHHSWVRNCVCCSSITQCWLLWNLSRCWACTVIQIIINVIIILHIVCIEENIICVCECYSCTCTIWISVNISIV